MPLAIIMFRVWAQSCVEQKPLSKLILEVECLNTSTGRQMLVLTRWWQQLVEVWVSLGLTHRSHWVHLGSCSALQSPGHSVVQQLRPL